MARLNTKSARLERQKTIINHFLSKGFVLEEYKNIKMVYSLTAQRILVWVGSAATASSNDYFFAGQNNLNAKIAEFKAAQDRLDAHKAKRSVATGYSASVASVAKAIRQELKRVFKNIKFSVTSESFSMGNAVNIHWTDGPTVDMVEAITNKYQYGQYNSMEDIYELSHVSKELPQAKYICPRREISQEIKSSLLAQAELLIPHEASVMLYRIMRRTEFPAESTKASYRLKEKAGTSSGFIDQLFEIQIQA